MNRPTQITTFTAARYPRLPTEPQSLPSRGSLQLPPEEGQQPFDAVRAALFFSDRGDSGADAGEDVRDDPVAPLAGERIERGRGRARARQQLAAEQAARPVQPGLHDVRAELETLRGFLRGHVLDRAQHEDRAVGLRE